MAVAGTSDSSCSAGCRLASMDTLITPAQRKALILVAGICFALMWLVQLRLEYVIAR